MSEPRRADVSRGQIPTRHPQYYLNEGMIFLVEDQLFRIPRYMLELNAPVFKGMFALPSSSEEGLTDVNPIRLEQVKSVEFHRLLAFLYPMTTQYETFTDAWGYQEWLSILHLATRWEMDKIRERAISRLDKLNRFPSPIAKLSSGREFEWPSWVRDGFRALVSRSDPLSEEEGYQLGMKDALRCAAVREMVQKRTAHRGYPVALSVDDALDKVFGEDIPKQERGAGKPITETSLFEYEY